MVNKESNTAKSEPSEHSCAVCHSTVTGKNAYKLEHEGETFWLCNQICLKRFAQIPCRFECQDKHYRKQKHSA